MRMKPVISILLLCITTFVCASQSLPVAVYNESKVDSLCRIVQNPEVSYSKKVDMMRRYSNVSLYSEHFQKLSSLFNELLEEAYQSSDNNGILFCYNSLANLHLGLWEKESLERCLDSAEVYAARSNDNHGLASFYRVKGQYIQRYYPDRTPEAVSYYHKSLSHYDKITGMDDEVAVILRNLTMDGFQRIDSAYICKNIHKIKDLKDRNHSPIIDFYFKDVLVSLHMVYYQTTSESPFLDTAIYYTNQCIELYENGLLPLSFHHIAVDYYTVVAELMSMKNDSDLPTIDSLLSVAEKNVNRSDSMGLSRIYQVRAQMFFKRNEVDSAKVMALEAQKYLQAGYKNNYYSLVKSNMALLRDICILKGEYRKAMEYDDWWTRTDEEIKANVVKELELQYEVDAKDAELRQLNSDVQYHKNRQKMYIAICLLLCLATFFVILLIRLKKKNLNSRMALMDAEREEVKLKLKLKEEQAVKVELEKYEVLSDFHLKEMELIGKAKDLEQLYRDKEALDKQVESFRRKVEEYETSVERSEQTNYDKQNVILEDLRRLISRQVPNNSGDYIRKLNALNDSYIDVLCEKGDGNFSVSYLKYCICFAVGMGISEVAECFGIEQSSVHMIRYRLKKKFRLGNDDDLGVFLQEQAGGLDRMPEA